MDSGIISSGKLARAFFTGQELLHGRMQQSVISFKRRKELKQDEAKIAAGIYAMKVPYDQKIRAWEEQTGLKGERSFYRALNRLGS